MSRHLQAERPGILVLGPPGAGKTTLALGLCRTFPELGHLAPRRFLLDERRRGTALAARAFGILERQTLLPEEFFVEAARRLDAQGRFRHGFVLEGLPVTVTQGELLWEAVLGAPAVQIVVLALHVADAVMRARVAARRSCEACECAGSVDALAAAGDRCPDCGEPVGRRSEDQPARLTARLNAQRREAGALLRWLSLRAVVVHIDGERPIDEVLDTAVRVVAAAVPDWPALRAIAGGSR